MMIDDIINESDDKGAAIRDVMMDEISYRTDFKKVIGELVDWFAGTTDFDESLFDFIVEWVEEYASE